MMHFSTSDENVREKVLYGCKVTQFHSDDQPELNLENDYQNETGHDLTLFVLPTVFAKHLKNGYAKVCDF